MACASFLLNWLWISFIPNSMEIILNNLIRFENEMYKNGWQFTFDSAIDIDVWPRQNANRKIPAWKKQSNGALRRISLYSTEINCTVRLLVGASHIQPRQLYTDRQANFHRIFRTVVSNTILLCHRRFRGSNGCAGDCIHGHRNSGKWAVNTRPSHTYEVE